ncbi:hypothetical protein FQA39_LY17386 [Lamprigera yunnana]|nr:hypothetical protein FQA39_LY17386 [Lamprigera yunnana]
MALVCDIKSGSSVLKPEEEAQVVNDDLEDGEIEDDDEEETSTPAETQQEPNPELPPPNASPNKFRPTRFDRPDRHRYEDRKRSHLTEAEKSVLHLHKIERLEREKRDRYKRDQTTTVDDFASNIEKAIANVLRKDKKRSDDEKEDEDKRGKKRKRKDKDKKKTKQHKSSPKVDDIDESEILNVRGCSPVQTMKEQSRSPTPRSDYDSYDSSTSSSSRDKREKRKDDKKSHPKNNDKKFKDRNREQKVDAQQKDAQGVCLFYLQGKCAKENDCPFSHELSQPLKLELCKFYIMGCCAKGEKCYYMHSDFPCKFYHTGLPCYAGDSCKFAHGKPLEEGLRQILFKHIETAPKEILGDFPRLSREGALSMINQAQKVLETKYGVEKSNNTSADANNDKTAIPSLFELNIPVPAELLQKDEMKSKEKGDKPSRERNRPSRWQDADPVDNSANTISEQKPSVHLTFGLKGFYSERGDQDMRINSNGDIDMRTLPPPLNSVPAPLTIVAQDTDIRNITQDTDIRQLNLDTKVDFSKDIDIRQITQYEQLAPTNDDNDPMTDEPSLEIVMEENMEERTDAKLPANLPKKQRELFLRIKAQQKDNVPDTPREASDDDMNNIDWYSDDDDDDDDHRLTIRDDIEDAKIKEEPEVFPLPSQIKPVEVIEKLGDLSKIDISAEVTKMLLSSISKSGVLSKDTSVSKDPRVATQVPDIKSSVNIADPRRSRVNSSETKCPEKVSIYDQGSISIDNTVSKDIDLRMLEKDMDLRPKFGDTDLRAAQSTGRSDIDLRQLGLPFKAMKNYTPASEIDACINSHVPIIWKVHLIEIPRPDYTGLKLSPHEAQNTGDPRLRKIFRLNSTEEKDSPASPKEVPKTTSTTVRIDPRRRKMEEKSATTDTGNQMTYSQQLNILQGSAFYQSLTSNQKVLLNQELASKYDHSGSNDPTLNGILSNLGLLTSGATSIIPNTNSTANTSALNILANINNLNPMLGQAQNIIPNAPFVNQNVNPNILSQNPNVVNQMAQSIVQPGLLGAAPGVPNLPPDFQLNFDPRQGGLLGNAPSFNYNDNQNFNFNDDYYEEGNNFMESNNTGRGGRGNRGGFRDRQQQRRGRSFNNRNVGRNFRNRNRNNNRSRTPP